MFVGDGLMVVFPSAVGAVRCAIGMQQAIQRHNAQATTTSLGVRVGLHVAPGRGRADRAQAQRVAGARRCERSGRSARRAHA